MPPPGCGACPSASAPGSRSSCPDRLAGAPGARCGPTRPGITTKHPRVNCRPPRRRNALIICQAMTITMTVALPAPLAGFGTTRTGPDCPVAGGPDLVEAAIWPIEWRPAWARRAAVISIMPRLRRSRAGCRRTDACASGVVDRAGSGVTLQAVRIPQLLPATHALADFADGFLQVVLLRSGLEHLGGLFHHISRCPKRCFLSFGIGVSKATLATRSGISPTPACACGGRRD